MMLTHVDLIEKLLFVVFLFFLPLETQAEGILTGNTTVGLLHASIREQP